MRYITVGKTIVGKMIRRIEPKAKLLGYVGELFYYVSECYFDVLSDKYPPNPQFPVVEYKATVDNIRRVKYHRESNTFYIEVIAGTLSSSLPARNCIYKSWKIFNLLSNK